MNPNLNAHEPDKSKRREVEVTTPFGRVIFGGPTLQVIAGPCSIESRDHLFETGTFVKASGATLLRGGIFKMRTDVTSFQGLGVSAFEFLPAVQSELRMPLVCEITDPRQLAAMIDTVDIVQVGSRNMYNYELLKELGRTQKAVLLKRAFAATTGEWLKAAEYVLRGGNSKVILCERGIRTFENSTRNTLDLNSVAWIKANTDFPILVDPSHGTGVRALVAPMAMAAIAAGADGLIIETHPQPLRALSDGQQTLDFSEFAELMLKLNGLAKVLGRDFAGPTRSMALDH